MVVTYAAAGHRHRRRIIASPFRNPAAAGRNRNVGGAGGMTGAARVAKARPTDTCFVLERRHSCPEQTLYKVRSTRGDPISRRSVCCRLPMVMVSRTNCLQQPAGIHRLREGHQAKMQYGSAGTVPPPTCLALSMRRSA